MNRFYTQTKVLAVLSDGKPRCAREIVKLTALSDGAADNALRRLWKRKLIQRTKVPISKNERIFKGRAGVSRNTRSYHMYILYPNSQNSIRVNGFEFVQYDETFLDARGGEREAKLKLFLIFLRKIKIKPFFQKTLLLVLLMRA